METSHNVKINSAEQAFQPGKTQTQFLHQYPEVVFGPRPNSEKVSRNA